MSNYIEYYYDNGNTQITMVEGGYAIMEFFPVSQSEVSYESLEYSNMFCMEDILVAYNLPSYHINKPSDVTNEETLKIKERVKELKNKKELQQCNIRTK